ncbi:MAG TPA: hypothetical protein VET85_02125 [Stellaceae bacterium]|nr:hypothetical protein [Stellaceae bacterium]
MRVVLALGLASVIASEGATAQSRGGHDAFHWWYQTLKSPEGESCCNAKDCHPVDSRYLEGPAGDWTLEIRIGDRWVAVPRSRILPQSSPDGGVHACYSDPAPFMTETSPGLIIRCVITGGIS